MVISDTTISNGLVAHQLPLMILGNLIFFLPTDFLPRLVLERIPANLQHVCAKLSEKTNRFCYELSLQDNDNL